VTQSNDNGGLDVRKFWREHLPQMREALSAEIIPEILTDNHVFNEQLVRFLLSLNDETLTKLVIQHQQLAPIMLSEMAKGDGRLHKEQIDQLLLLVAKDDNGSNEALLLLGKNNSRDMQLKMGVQQLFQRFQPQDQVVLARLFVRDDSRYQLFSTMTSEQFRRLCESNPQQDDPRVDDSPKVLTSVVEKINDITEMYAHRLLTDTEKRLVDTFKLFLTKEVIHVRKIEILQPILDNNEWCVSAFRDREKPELMSFLSNIPSREMQKIVSEKFVALAKDIGLADFLSQIQGDDLLSLFTQNLCFAVAVCGNDELRQAAGFGVNAMLQFLNKTPDHPLLDELLANGNESCRQFLASVYAYAPDGFKQNVLGSQLNARLQALQQAELVQPQRPQKHPSTDPAWRQLQFVPGPNNHDTAVFNGKIAMAIELESKKPLAAIVWFRKSYQDKQASVEHKSKSVRYFDQVGNAALLLKILHLSIDNKDMQFEVDEKDKVIVPLWTKLESTIKELLEIPLPDRQPITPAQLRLDQLLAGPKDSPGTKPLLFALMQQMNVTVDANPIDPTEIMMYVLDMLRDNNVGAIPELFELLQQGAKVYPDLAEKQSDDVKAWPFLCAATICAQEMNDHAEAEYFQLFLDQDSLSAARCETYYRALQLMPENQGDDEHPLLKEIMLRPVALAKHQAYLAKYFLALSKNTSKAEIAAEYVSRAKFILQALVEHPKYILDQVFENASFRISSAELQPLAGDDLLLPLIMHKTLCENWIPNELNSLLGKSRLLAEAVFAQPHLLNMLSRDQALKCVVRIVPTSADKTAEQTSNDRANYILDSLVVERQFVVKHGVESWARSAKVGVVGALSSVTEVPSSPILRPTNSRNMLAALGGAQQMVDDLSGSVAPPTPPTPPAAPAFTKPSAAPVAPTAPAFVGQPPAPAVAPTPPAVAEPSAAPVVSPPAVAEQPSSSLLVVSPPPAELCSRFVHDFSSVKLNKTPDAEPKRDSEPEGMDAVLNAGFESMRGKLLNTENNSPSSPGAWDDDDQNDNSFDFS